MRKPIRAVPKFDSSKTKPWNWSQRQRPDGTTIVYLEAPYSADTLTTVKYEASLFMPELNQAAVTVRLHPDISNTALRKEFPEVSKRCSDVHLDKLKGMGGRVRSLKKFTAAVFADAAGYLEENTVYGYLKAPRSRQIKKAERGRPRK